MLPPREPSPSRVAGGDNLRAGNEEEAMSSYRDSQITTASEMMRSPLSPSPLRPTQHFENHATRFPNPATLSYFGMNPPGYFNRVQLISASSPYTNNDHSFSSSSLGRLVEAAPSDGFPADGSAPVPAEHQVSESTASDNNTYAGSTSFMNDSMAGFTPFPAGYFAAGPFGGFSEHHGPESRASGNDTRAGSTSFMNNPMAGVTPSAAGYSAAGPCRGFSEHHDPESTAIENNTRAFLNAFMDDVIDLDSMADGFSFPYSSTQECEQPRIQTTYTGSQYSNTVSPMNGGMVNPTLQNVLSAYSSSSDSLDRLSEVHRYGRRIFERNEQEVFDDFNAGGIINTHRCYSAHAPNSAPGGLAAPVLFQFPSMISCSRPNSLPPPMMVGLDAHPAVLDKKASKKHRKGKGRMSELTQDGENEGKEKKRGFWSQLFSRKGKGGKRSAEHEEEKQSWKWWNLFSGFSGL